VRSSGGTPGCRGIYPCLSAGQRAGAPLRAVGGAAEPRGGLAPYRGRTYGRLGPLGEMTDRRAGHEGGCPATLEGLLAIGDVPSLSPPRARLQASSRDASRTEALVALGLRAALPSCRGRPPNGVSVIWTRHERPCQRHVPETALLGRQG
jgi:hypothetical protein